MKRRELQEGIIRAGGNIQFRVLSNVCERWGKRPQQGDAEKKELQEMLPRNEKIQGHEEAERKKASHIAKHAVLWALTQFFFFTSFMSTVFR